MPVLQIGAKDFVKGVSTSNDLPDGGFSPSNKGVNPLLTLGGIRGGAEFTSKSSNLTASETIIASTIDGAASGNDLYFVGAPSGTGASFYKWSSYATEPVKSKTDVGAHTYSVGKTDMKYFGTDTFVTSATDITKLTNNFADIDEDWWSTAGGTALTSTYPHPMLVFDLKLWIADGTLLHNWDGSQVNNSVLDLGSQRTITALGRYEATGDMLIGVEQNYNISDGVAYQSRILVWDGFSAVVNQEIFVDGKITSFYNHGGITYVFYDRNLGYFNGSGITFLRRLNINYSQNSLIYPHKVTSANNILYIAEGSDVLAYGKLYGGGNNVFWYPYSNGAFTSATQINYLRHFRNIGDTTSTLLAMSAGVSGAITNGYINLDTAISGNTFRSNKYFLGQNCRIQKVEMFTDVLSAGALFNAVLYFSKNLGTTTAIGTMDFTTDGAIYQKTFRAFDVVTSLIQIGVSLPATPALKQINIYYEPIEKPV